MCDFIHSESGACIGGNPCEEYKKLLIKITNKDIDITTLKKAQTNLVEHQNYLFSVVDKLCLDNDVYANRNVNLCIDNHGLRTEIEILKTELAQAVKLLKMLEWESFAYNRKRSEDMAFCPICHNWGPREHDPTCELGNFLKGK